MIVGIPDEAWRRIRRSVHFTERREVGAGGRLPLGLGSGAPVFVRVGELAAGRVMTCEACTGGAPRVWAVTLAGFATCDGDVDPNGELRLTHESGCTWAGSLNDIGWTLAYTAGLWTLTDDGAIGATYHLTGSSWACAGPNDLSRADVSGCATSAESVTLTAASGVTVHAGAYEAVFQRWDNAAAVFVDVDEPNDCYAVDVNREELVAGIVYHGGVVWQYAENGRVLVAVTGVATNPSGSGSGTDTDGDGTADRRLVGYNYDVSCSGGILTKTRQPIYQFLGSGLSSYGGWETVGAIGCCECDDDPGDGGPTGGDTGAESIPCDECFGEGTPHPSNTEPDVPEFLTATWTDLSQDQAFEHDNGERDWQAGSPTLTGAAFDGLINMTISLCTGTANPHTLVMNFSDNTKDATIDLTLISCDPLMLVGEGAQGRVVITE